MDNQQAKDEAASLRAQAKRFREMGRFNRKLARQLKAKRDPVAAMKADWVAQDHYGYARQYEARAKELMAFAKLVKR